DFSAGHGLRRGKPGSDVRGVVRKEALGTFFGAAILAWPFLSKTIRRKTMKRLIGVLVGALAELVSGSAIPAQGLLVPAGTLLQCTMHEPNFSSKTAAIGDPRVFHLRPCPEFDKPTSPR